MIDSDAIILSWSLIRWYATLPSFSFLCATWFLFAIVFDSFLAGLYLYTIHTLKFLKFYGYFWNTVAFQKDASRNFIDAIFITMHSSSRNCALRVIKLAVRDYNGESLFRLPSTSTPKTLSLRSCALDFVILPVRFINRKASRHSRNLHEHYMSTSSSVWSITVSLSP